MTTSVVTGAAGFIGYGLARILAEDPDHHVVLVDNLLRGKRDAAFEALAARANTTFLEVDLSAPDATAKLPTEQVDFVFHLAAYNGTQNFYAHPYDVLRHSTLPTFTLIDHYVKHRRVTQRFLYAGSSEAYAGTISRFGWPVPTGEDVPLSIEDPQNPRWSYGVSKLHGEVLTCAAGKEFGVPYTSIRYHNVYGPRMGDKHVMPDFVERMNRGVYELYGHEETRSFLYIDDAVAATLALARSPAAAGEIVNVGDDREITMAGLGKMMMKSAKVDAQIVLHPSPAGSVKRRAPKLDKLRSLTGFKPEWTLERGLDATVAWYQVHAR